MIRFSFSQESERPVLDLAPHHSRMVASYRDRAGRVHLFTDFIEAEQQTGASWMAQIRYLSSPDLRQWTDHGLVVERGAQGEDRSDDPFDVYGAASPDVLCTGDKVYLAYAARDGLRPGDPADGRMLPGEPGYIRGRIGLCVADADDQGAPILPFRKLGPVTHLGTDFDRTRHDDPSLVLEGDRLWLYYKVIGDRAYDSRKSVRISASLDQLDFDRPKGVNFELPGGIEMPRVFKMRDVWYMFVRPFDHSLGTWQHYRSHTGENWELVDGNVFDPEPPVGADAADMKPVFALQGEMLPDPLVLACGVGEQGNLCQWLYRLECSTG